MHKLVTYTILSGFLAASRQISDDNSLQTWLENDVKSICVTGVSNSGKTYFVKNYLADHLRDKYGLDVKVIHQDNYWIRPPSYNEYDFFVVANKTRLLKNLEAFSAIDNQLLWDDMHDTIDFWAHFSTILFGN